MQLRKSKAHTRATVQRAIFEARAEWQFPKSAFIRQKSRDRMPYWLSMTGSRYSQLSAERPRVSQRLVGALEINGATEMETFWAMERNSN
jgi:hypothetical protein